jgi:hypothetical protein
MAAAPLLSSLDHGAARIIVTVPAEATHLKEAFRFQAGACRFMGSPFTGDLLDASASKIGAGGVLDEILAGWFGSPIAELAHSVLPLRLAGALHRVVLTGADAALSAAYPGPGKSGDGAAAWRAAEAYIADHKAWFVERLDQPPQTNEVRRSAALMAGLLTLAGECRMPFSLLELGASAGLNLNLDAFSYRNDVWRWGAGDDLVIDTEWSGGSPPLVPFTVAARAGCDRNPLDPASEEDRLTLTSFVWPDQFDRLDRLRRALDIALRRGGKVERADAADWVEARLADRSAGCVTVVYHSVFYQYPPPATRERIDRAIRAAGAAATPEAPLAWLRFEPESALNGSVTDYRGVLDLLAWPAGTHRVLAEVDAHGRNVRWLP